MPNPAIKDEKTYRALRREGNSEQKSARIANASAAQGSTAVGRKGGRAGSYDDWTKDELVQRAREIGIEGRSSMNKDELIHALRNS
ncbi:MAG TPA: Rho termination factor N-terminal domain-containing protein [Mycobacteriales bacterium]